MAANRSQTPSLAEADAMFRGMILGVDAALIVHSYPIFLKTNGKLPSHGMLAYPQVYVEFIGAEMDEEGNVLRPVGLVKKKGDNSKKQGINKIPFMNVELNLAGLQEDACIIVKHLCPGRCNIVEDRHFGWGKVPIKQLMNILLSNESVDYQMKCPFGSPIGTVRFSHVMINNSQKCSSLGWVVGWLGRATASACGGCAADCITGG